MKKLFIALTTLSLTSGLAALTDAQVKTQASDILSGIVSGHNFAFGKDNLYKEALDLSMWNKAISNMKSFVTTIINENRNFFGMRSSTLTSALDKITKAEIDLVNNIKITRSVLKSPANLERQINILNQIKDDMVAVQKTLAGSITPVAKDVAQKLLKDTAMFIEITAAKGAKDALK